MRARLEPRRYHDPGLHEEERRALFGRSWAYAGLALDLTGPGSFFRAELGGRDVLVRDCGGAVRAFLNVCSHRHARLCAAERGSGPLVCPYHGWGYDEAGVPRAIPAREEFSEVAADPEAFRLPAFEVDAAGAFLFVRSSTEGPALAEWLGPARGVLLRVSEGLGAELDAFRQTAACDWKVLLENSLEDYHVPRLHRDSLGGLPELEESEHSLWENGHSASLQKAEAAWLRRWSALEMLTGSRPMAEEGLLHLHVFPNLTVSTFMGLSFHVQRHEPAGPERCALSTRTFASRFEGGTPEGARLLTGLYRDGRASTREVFAEDVRVCESVQLGLRQAGRRALLADRQERRIAHFQSAYLASLRARRPAPEAAA